MNERKPANTITFTIQARPKVAMTTLSAMASLLSVGVAAPSSLRPRFTRSRGNKYAERSSAIPAHSLTKKMPGTDRNSPCVCGSGIKTKKCKCVDHIVKFDHPALSSISEPCTEADLKDPVMFTRLRGSCRRTAHGLGLASNQINWLKQVVYLRSMDLFLINPEIVESSTAMSEGEEGCLSYPGTTTRINRHVSVLVRYRDRSWQECQTTFVGMDARVIQHELDHLAGVVSRR